MRSLEARFHPFEHESPTFIVIGHVVWEDEKDASAARVEPSAALEKQTASSTILATLRHLVNMTTPHSYERLQVLRSRFWSFVRIDDAAPPPANQS